MDDRPHKAHRPSHAEKKGKGKGKEKQQGFNAKVRHILPKFLLFDILVRHLRQNLVGELTGKDVVQ